MNLSDNNCVSFSGVLDIVKYDEHGNITDTRKVKNLVVTTGKTLIAKLVTGTGTSVTHMAIGSASTTPAAADTTLGLELARVAFASKTSSSNVMSFVAIFPAGSGTGTLQEAGLFNSSTAGELMCRSTFTSISKGANDVISITWTVTAN